MAKKYITNPTQRYDGPDFEEYCISASKYLSANRDRVSCVSCPLNNLCIPGFEEQVRKLQNGENPSLTEGCSFKPEQLTTDSLFEGLNEEQINFVKKHIPNL
ncbi:hypothetical protein [Pedobacter sp. V48]|uniref:hypothetical protein n=1 Tax=Pedobacter sp. V48 TaxID=509635 RepID=UPI0003E553E8|nr:hypothetical protein [Pedobacter sp. V48]ETZ22827.1 hypothetical protein N824_21295 [Pedobacter sp. V48]